MWFNRKRKFGTVSRLKIKIRISKTMYLFKLYIHQKGFNTQGTDKQLFILAWRSLVALFIEHVLLNDSIWSISASKAENSFKRGGKSAAEVPGMCLWLSYIAFDMGEMYVPVCCCGHLSTKATRSDYKNAMFVSYCQNNPQPPQGSYWFYILRLRHFVCLCVRFAIRVNYF